MRTEESVLTEVKGYLADAELSLAELNGAVEDGHLNRVGAVLAVAMESLGEARRVVLRRLLETSMKGKGVNG